MQSTRIIVKFSGFFLLKMMLLANFVKVGFLNEFVSSVIALRENQTLVTENCLKY